jgi:hypothetical protein
MTARATAIERRFIESSERDTSIAATETYRKSSRQ